jgi:uncharacterized cupredoxin-like copper-binding protein
MSRPNSNRWLIFPALLLAVAVVACGVGGDEQTLLNKYFMASKVADNMTLANIATVAFNPKTDGQMMSFSILSVSPEKVEPLELKVKAAELKTAVDRILKAEGKNQTLKGKDAELQKEWTKWREETAVYAKKVSEIRKVVNAGLPIVEISCQDQRNPIDVQAYEGDIASKDITIEGQVRQEAGTSTKKFVFTLRRVTLKGVNGKDVVGRWVITDRKDAQ